MTYRVGFRRAVWGGAAAAPAATGADALLTGHAQGFALLAANGDGAGQVSVKDTGTPANDLSNAAAADLFTNGGTSVKYVLGTDLAYSQVSAGDPAFEYDPDASAHRMLIEPQATNLHTYASDRSNAAWVKTDVTISADAGQAPDGTTTMDKIVESATSAAHYIPQAKIGLSSGDPYTYSEIVAAAGRTRCFMYLYTSATAIAYFDLSAGTVTSTSGSASPTATIEELDTVGGVTRYRISITASIAQTSINAGIGPTTADGIISYLGNGSSGILVWGSQREAGTVASSPIPTAGAAVARSADQNYVASSAVPYSATAGTLYIKCTTPRDGSAAVLAQWDDGTADERVRVEYTGTNVQCVVTDGGSAVATLDLGAVAADTDVQVTLAWQADSIAASLDGGAVVTDTDTGGGLPTMDTFRLGYSPAGEQGIIYIDKLVYVPERVSNANLPTWRYAA